MTRADFWWGMVFLAANMWLLGTALEREFIKRMNRLIDVIWEARDRK